MVATGATWGNGGADAFTAGVDGIGVAVGEALAAAGLGFWGALLADVLQAVTETAMTRAAMGGRRRWRGW